MKIRTATLTILATAALAAGCSSDSEPAAEPAAAPEAEAAPATDAAAEPAAAATDGAGINIEGFAFSALGPVAPGTEITVSNLDGAAHTLTADDGSFNTGGVDGGAAGSITAPSEPGTYTFVCNFHPSMTGSLTVEG